MELITNIDIIRIPLVTGQRIYYLPYKRRQIVPQSIVMAFDYNLFNSYKDALYLTLTDDNGNYITKDYDLHMSFAQSFSKGNLHIDRQVNFDTSFVRIPEVVNFNQGDEINLFVIYSQESSSVKMNGKILTLTFTGKPEEQRLSDYITGYQGDILRIEYDSGQNGPDGLITLTDAGGRGIAAPLEMFSSASSVARIFNPYNFMPISPIWQNSKIHCASDVTLNFVFAK